MHGLGIKERMSANLDGTRRVHPFGALFLFGDKSFMIYLCNIYQIGEEGTVEGTIRADLGTSKD
jgi:hypothetical protein